MGTIAIVTDSNSGITQAAAKELGICSRNVYNLCHRADFPTVRIGQRVRISRAGLAEWVRAQEQNRARA